MNIGLLVYPGCVASGLFAFAELLEVANKRAGKTIFSITWVGQDTQSVPISAGSKLVVAKIEVESTFLDSTFDALIIPGFWSNSQRHVARAIDSYSELITKLKRLSPKTQLWGYCSAVCLMAESGRMDKHTATTTWWLADFVQDKYPMVNWQFGQTCVTDAKNTTASGLNGYLPIAQALIEKHCGLDILRDIIDVMIIPKPETQVQPFTQYKLMQMDNKLLQQIYVWVEMTPATDLTVSKLAKHLNQTERTLARHVKQLSNISVANFMRLIKLEQASELLIYSRKPINSISDGLGFSDDAAFRRSFKKVSSYTPSEYRLAFQR